MLFAAGCLPFSAFAAQREARAFRVNFRFIPLDTIFVLIAAGTDIPLQDDCVAGLEILLYKLGLLPEKGKFR